MRKEFRSGQIASQPVYEHCGRVRRRRERIKAGVVGVQLVAARRASAVNAGRAKRDHAGNDDQSNPGVQGKTCCDVATGKIERESRRKSCCDIATERLLDQVCKFPREFGNAVFTVHRMFS